MKRLSLSAAALCAALALNAQWGAGVRDTRYVNVSYTFLSHWRAKLEHSVYAESFSRQYVRLYMAYRRRFGRLSISGEPYFGMTYSNSYRSMGFNIDAGADITRWMFAEAGFTPHYDSGTGYSSLYKASLGFRCTGNIAAIGTFTNRPENRMPEKRMRAGVRFSVKNLWAFPEVSFPVERGKGLGLHFMASMGYTF